MNERKLRIEHMHFLYNKQICKSYTKNNQDKASQEYCFKCIFYTAEITK